MILVFILKLLESRKEDEKADRFAQEFKARAKSRLSNNTSRVEFQDKYGRTIKARHDYLQY